MTDNFFKIYLFDIAMYVNGLQEHKWPSVHFILGELPSPLAHVIYRK